MPPRKKIVIFGAGGCAREICWLLREINAQQPRFEFLGYVISDLSQLTDRDSRDQVLGDLHWLQKNRSKVDAIALGIGTATTRLKLAQEISSLMPDLEWPSLIHPQALLDRETCKVSPGAILCAHSVTTVHVTIENFALVGVSCTLGHEATIGAGSVLNPGSNISGGVQIGAGVLIGTGAQVLQYLTVGEGAIIGAGAVVTRNVAPRTTVVGSPAKALRK